MTHKFDPARWQRLEDPRRRRTLPPGRVLDRMGLSAGQVLVDVGSGTGYFSLPAARRVGPAGRVYAVDISQEMLDRLRERMAQEGAEDLPLTLVRSGETEIPLPAGVAHHVLTALVFHEVTAQDRPAFVAELSRLLRPQGLLTIVDWAPVPSPLGPPLSERLPRALVEEALAGAGLTMTAARTTGRYFYLVQARQG